MLRCWEEQTQGEVVRVRSKGGNPGGGYLLDFVYDEVAFVAENDGRFSVLFGQQVEPQSQAVYHGQNDGPQEVQNIQDPLDHLPVD